MGVLFKVCVLGASFEEITKESLHKERIGVHGGITINYKEKGKTRGGVCVVVCRYSLI